MANLQVNRSGIDSITLTLNVQEAKALKVALGIILHNGTQPAKITYPIYCALDDEPELYVDPNSYRGSIEFLRDEL